METKRFTEQDGSLGTTTARAQRTPAPAPLAIPAYADPRLEALWNYQAERAAVGTRTDPSPSDGPAPAEAA